MQSLLRRAFLPLAQCLILVVLLPARLMRAGNPVLMGPGFLLRRRGKRRQVRSSSTVVLIGALTGALMLSSLTGPASATEAPEEPAQSAQTVEPLPEPAPDPVVEPLNPAPKPEVAPAEQPQTAEEGGELTAPTEAPTTLSVSSLPPLSGSNGIASGMRSAASMVERSLTDQVTLGWNPTNGNIVLIGDLFKIKGVSTDVDVSLRYNSLNDDRPMFNMGTVEASVKVTADDQIIYTADDGGVYTFEPDGSGGWIMPPGLNASITSFFPDYSLGIRFNDTGFTNFYSASGDRFVLRSTNDTYPDLPNQVTYYDTDGRLVSTTDTKFQQIDYYYGDSDNDQQPSQITDTTINRSIYADYDSNGRMRQLVDAAGSTLDFAYNSEGKLAGIIDGRGNTTSFLYDANGRATKITYGSGTTAQSIWNSAYPTSTSTTLTDPNNRTATYTHNASKQVTKVTDPNGNAISSSYDAHDNRTSSTDGLGDLTTAVYNPNTTLARITSPRAGTTGTAADVAFTYPADNGIDGIFDYKPLTSIDSEGQTTSYSYDGTTTYLQQTNTPGLLGGQLKNFYQNDDAGTACGAQRTQLCKTIDGKGNVTSYGYDANRNVTSITRPAPLGVLTFTHDAVGRVITSKDGKNQILNYVYDGNDRLKQVRQGSTCVAATCVTYTYDANGNLTQRVDAAGTTTYTYDAQNRANAKTIGGITTTLTYDGASNILTFTDPTGTVGYKYDPGNRLISLAEPGGSCPTTPVFPNTTKCSGFDYDKNNRRTVTKYPTGVKNTTVFDKAGRTASITATNSTGTILTRRAYTFTATTAGKEGSLRKTMTSETGAVTTYSYDATQRLTKTVAGTVTETWGYDKNSNRILDTKTGTANVHSVFNAADQLCWAGSATGACSTPPAGAAVYAYDANGSTTGAGASTRAYNVFDQQTSATVSGATRSFGYAGVGNTERTSSGTTAFLNGSLGITRQTTAGATTSFIRDPEGTLISMRNSAGSFYYTFDALGSITTLTDSSQTRVANYTYDSWGNTTSTGAQAANNPWQWAGGYYDATTSRIKFGARYYNPFRGRFTQVDPSMQETNRYLYAEANPCNKTDPSGLATEEQLNDFAANLICGFGFFGLSFLSFGVGAVGGLLICSAVGAITTFTD